MPGRRLILSVPLLPGPWDLTGPKEGPRAKQPVSLKAGAHGDYNAHFKALAENLVRYGLGDSVVRLGWEFNGGWYAWRAGGDPASPLSPVGFIRPLSPHKKGAAKAAEVGEQLNG